MTNRIFGAALALASGAVLLGTAAGAAAAAGSPEPAPAPFTRAGGLLPGEAHAVAGDCELTGVVTCRPALTGSCSNAVSTTTPPSATTPIKVLVRTGPSTVTISSVPFETYVEDVLPNEWVPSFDGDARKAGAIAVKSYAWYWMSHFGGYVDDDPGQCFDVTDDADFQVYAAGSAQDATTSSITQTWPVFARKNGQVFQTSYRKYFSSTKERCGAKSAAYPDQLSQYGSQNCNDPDLGLGGSTADKYNVILQLYYGSDLQLSTTAQLRTQHDFQFLHRSTPATFSNGNWSIADGYPTALHFGLKGDVAVVNTVGDGFARLGVYRPSTRTWYLATPTGGVATSFHFGLAGDVPVAAQFHGLGAATQVALWRPSNGTWYLAGPHGGTAASIQYGRRGDVPVPGRWTTAGADSLAVYRPSNRTWYVRGGPTVHYGLKGDIAVPADYTGDGRTDIAVYRPSTREFYVRGRAGVHWGLKGDVPVTGDFTGDGRADIAVYRPANHTLYVRGGSTTVLPAGTPIGAAPYHD